MKLRTLLLKKKLDDLNKNLEDLRAKDAEFEKREAELTEAFNEVSDETPAEDRKSVEDEMEKFDADNAEHDQQKKDLEAEIAKTETELSALEEKQEEKAPVNEPAPADKPVEARKAKINMNVRFKNWSVEERSAFVERDEVKTWIGNVRSMIKEKRSVTGADLTIPETVLPLIRSAAYDYSKLMKHVHKVNVAGNARQPIVGDIPEGIWTEACASLNEVNLEITQVEVDGYKVGAYVPVCNAVLEDSDANLASEIIEALGAGLGYAVDKAIVYGTGFKMPTGFAAGATKVDASGKAGAKLFAEILKGCANLKHASGEKFWVMTEGTKAKLMSEGLSINAAGAIVTGVNGTMPIVGGVIETLDFVPEDEILGGFGDRYLLAERAGMTFATSSEVKFVEDQTVFKGTGRYDGKPVFADSFIAIGLAGAPTAAIDPSHPYHAYK